MEAKEARAVADARLAALPGYGDVVVNARADVMRARDHLARAKAAVEVAARADERNPGGKATTEALAKAKQDLVAASERVDSAEWILQQANARVPHAIEDLENAMVRANRLASHVNQPPPFGAEALAKVEHAKREFAPMFESGKKTPSVADPGLRSGAPPVVKNPRADLPEDPLTGAFASPRTDRATPPTPVEYDGKKWDVVGVEFVKGKPVVALKEAGVHRRYMPMTEVLKGRTVKYEGKDYTLQGVRQRIVALGEPPKDFLVLEPHAEGAEAAPLRVPQPPRNRTSLWHRPPAAPHQEYTGAEADLVKVSMEDANKVTITFKTGPSGAGPEHTYALGPVRFDSVLLTPQRETPAEPEARNSQVAGGANPSSASESSQHGDMLERKVPLSALGKEGFEVRLQGKELEGLFRLETKDGTTTIRPVDRPGETRPFTETDVVAGRYVEIYSPDFKGMAMLDAFHYREAQVRATATIDATKDDVPITDPLIGTLAPGKPSQLDHGTASFRHILGLLKGRSAQEPVTLFNFDLSFDDVASTSGEHEKTKEVLDALLSYRSHNSNATMRVIADERMWNNRPPNEAMVNTLLGAGIEFVYPQSTAKPRINHSKGICVGNDVVLMTGAVVPKVSEKAEVATALPPEAARLYVDYLKLTFKTDAFTGEDKAKLASLAAKLASKGVVVNDPMIKTPYAARAIDGLITGATRSIRVTVSELQDVATTQKLIEQAKKGLEVTIQHRGLDEKSREALSEAMRENPGLKLKVEDIAAWKPYPHFNAVFADGAQSYVGTAYLWPNQLVMAHHGLSHECGVVQGEDATKALLSQLDALQALQAGKAR
ncbi:hypothetical protein LY474_22125 [Myxococcus stipitatus]|uniref:hypothetical protein n=1 Tax=Myxococcus stipitatus TaxID=83455 RepID=UPI001F22A2C7|nr:hypothetical protein [Myxococcus stipitatus]MCE9670505.1 hypothetical protein [Myxococcus stipitatus]